MIMLGVIKELRGIVNRKVGDLIIYRSWPHEWQGMGEEERINKGIYVICYGHGEFEALRENEHVTHINNNNCCQARKPWNNCRTKENQPRGFKDE